VSAVAKEDGQPVELGGIEKMSKSKNNVVEPRDIIARHGADTARMFTMFAGPPQDSAAWSDAGVEGAHRYLRRLWSFAQRHADAVRGAAGAAAGPASPAAKALRREAHLLLKQISFDYDRLQYNTVVSGAMKLLNALEEAASDPGVVSSGALREGLSLLLRVLYPACPHATSCAARSRCLRRPVMPRSKPLPSLRRKSRSSARAAIRRRSSSCRASWSTWWSDRPRCAAVRCWLP
jgi:leucyl-tRNA synthetase